MYKTIEDYQNYIKDEFIGDMLETFKNTIDDIISYMFEKRYNLDIEIHSNIQDKWVNWSSDEKSMLLERIGILKLYNKLLEIKLNSTEESLLPNIFKYVDEYQYDGLLGVRDIEPITKKIISKVYYNFMKEIDKFNDPFDDNNTNFIVSILEEFMYVIDHCTLDYDKTIKSKHFEEYLDFIVSDGFLNGMTIIHNLANSCFENKLFDLDTNCNVEPGLSLWKKYKTTLELLRDQIEHNKCNIRDVGIELRDLFDIVLLYHEQQLYQGMRRDNVFETAHQNYYKWLYE